MGYAWNYKNKRPLTRFVITCVIGAVILLSGSASALAAPSNDTWQKIYKNEIKKVITADHLSQPDMWTAVLIDIDLDGTPELFIGYPPGTRGSWHYDYQYTVKEGKLIPLSSNIKWGYQSVEGIASSQLYYNPSTGETRVETFTGARSGAESHDLMLLTTSLSDNEINQRIEFTEYCTRDHDFEHTDCTYNHDATAYYIKDKKVTRSQYDPATKQWRKGWVKIPQFAISESLYITANDEAEIDQLINNYNNTVLKARASAASLTVNLSDKKDCMMYNINGHNYIKLRDLASLLNGTSKRFSVAWNQKSKTIGLHTGKAYTPVGGELASGKTVDMIAQYGNVVLSINDKQVRLTAYNINGNNYFKIRDIAAEIGLSINWDNANKTIQMDTNKSY